MFRLGKLLFGLAVAGVTAATVYSYLDESILLALNNQRF